MLKQLLQSGMCVLLLLPSLVATGQSAPELVYNTQSSGDGISGVLRRDLLTLGNMPIAANISRADVRFDNMRKHYTGNDCDAPLSNFAVQGTMSRPGAALDFDGSDDYVNVSYNLNQSSLTLEAWVKPTSNDRMYVICNDNPGSYGAGFGVNNYQLEIDCHNTFITVPGTLFNNGVAGDNNAGLTTLADLAGTAQNGTLTNFAPTGATNNWAAPTSFTSANATFAYLPADHTDGAVEAKYDPLNRTLPTTTSVTNSSTATGLTSFSGFMGGQLNPDYTITTTGNAIVITDISGNGDTLDVSESGSNISFVVTPTTRTYSIDGGAVTAFTTPADVALTGANSITINTEDGDDIIIVNISTNDIPDLIINGGAGNLDFSGSLINNSATDRDLILTSDGHITLSQQASGGMPLHITATAMGNITVGSTGFITNGGSFSASGVDITIQSNGLRTSHSNSALVGGSVVLALTGNLLIDQGGLETGGGGFSATGGVDATLRTVNTAWPGNDGGDISLALTGNLLISQSGVQTGGGDFSATGCVNITLQDNNLNTTRPNSVGGNVNFELTGDLDVLQGMQTGGGTVAATGGVNVDLLGLSTSLSGNTGGSITLTLTGNLRIAQSGVQTGGGDFSATGSVDATIMDGGLSTALTGGMGGSVTLALTNNLLVFHSGVQTGGGAFSANGGIGITITDAGLNTALTGETGGSVMLALTGNLRIEQSGVQTGGGDFSAIGGVDAILRAVNTSRSGNTGGSITLELTGNLWISQNGVQTGGGNFSATGSVDITITDGGLNTALTDGMGGSVTLTLSGNLLIEQGGVQTGGGDFSATGGVDAALRTVYTYRSGNTGGSVTLALTGNLVVQSNGVLTGGGDFLATGGVDVTITDVGLNTALTNGMGGSVTLALSGNLLIEQNGVQTGGGDFSATGGVDATLRMVNTSRSGNTGGSVTLTLSGNLLIEQGGVQTGGGDFSATGGVDAALRTVYTYRSGNTGGSVTLALTGNLVVQSNGVFTGGGDFFAAGGVDITITDAGLNTALTDGMGGSVTLGLSGNLFIEQNGGVQTGGGDFSATGGVDATLRMVNTSRSGNAGGSVTLALTGNLRIEQNGVQTDGGHFSSTGGVGITITGGGLRTALPGGLGGNVTLSLSGNLVVQSNGVFTGGGHFSATGGMDITITDAGLNTALTNGMGGSVTLGLSGNLFIEQNGGVQTGGGDFSATGGVDATLRMVNTSRSGNAGGSVTLALTGNLRIEQNGVQTDGGHFSSTGGVGITITGGGLRTALPGGLGGNVTLALTGNLVVQSNGVFTGGGHFSATGGMGITITDAGLNTALTNGMGGSVTLGLSGNLVIEQNGVQTGGGDFSATGGVDATLRIVNTSRSGNAGGGITLALTGNLRIEQIGLQTGGGHFTSTGGVGITITDGGLRTALPGGLGGSVTLALTGNLVIQSNGVLTGGGDFSATGGMDITITDAGLNTTLTNGMGGSVTLALSGNLLIEQNGMQTGGGDFSATGGVDATLRMVNTSRLGNTGGSITLALTGNLRIEQNGVQTGGGHFTSTGGVGITITDGGLRTALPGGLGGSVTLALTGNLVVQSNGVLTGGGDFSATGGMDFTIKEGGINVATIGGSATVTIQCTGNALLDTGNGIQANGNVSVAADALEIKATINTTAGTVTINAPNGASPKVAIPEVIATSLSFTSGNQLKISINGAIAPNADYDQLRVIGAVNLTGVTLVLSGAHTPAFGETFTIVDNDDTDAIIGTFNGLPEGATITNFLGSGLDATINYTGGTGNDVVLSLLCPPLIINAPDVTQPTCAVPTGTIVVNATGSSTLEYSVNNGANWQTSATFSDLTPDNYTILVRLQASPVCETAFVDNPVPLISPFSHTAIDIWTGCVSTDWATPGNWADGSVPTTSDDVTIPTTTNQPTIIATGAVAKSVTVLTGAVLTISSADTLTIDGSTTQGILNQGTVQNRGTILIGQTISTGNFGILNEANFHNNKGGEINIDRSTSRGIYNESGTFTNAATITIGAVASVGDYGLWNDSAFDNTACATLTNFAPVSNTDNFTNAGLFTSTTTDTHDNSGTLTNNGIIYYPLGNPIPNVVNNEVIIAPTTANDCALISPAFALGSPVDFTIVGIFTDAAATMSAGMYVTATNTFTPTVTLAEGTYRLFVKIQDGSGGCTRIVSWALTTQNCCPVLTAAAPPAVVSSQSTCTGCALSGGVIAPPAIACPIGSTLQYSTDNGSNWSTILPVYSPTTSITVLTRCNCNNDTNTSSPTSSVTTTPGTCVTPAAPVIGNNNGLALNCNNPSTVLSVSEPGNYTWALDGNPAGNGFFITATSAGTYIVKNTAANGCTATSSVMVTFTPDNTPPSITCPATQILVLGENCSAALPDYTNLATTGDNCGVQSVTQSPEAGTTVSGAGDMTVILTVTDINGLTNTCTFTVTKVDNTAPSITCPTRQILVLGANCNAALPDYTSLATTGDNCGVQSVTQSPVIGTTVSGAGDMAVTLTVTDINGLTNTCTFTVTKVDNTAPSITCPTRQILVLGENCSAALPDYTSLATTGDNCGVQSVTQSPAIGTTVSGAGDMIVTLTVTDINGLTNTCTFTVTKVDNTAPSITCPTRQILVLGANCNAALPDYTNLATTGDNCGVQSVAQSPAIGTTVSGAGDMIVTLTVTDINGLTNTCTFTVTKVDNTPPSITCPTRQILVLGANCNAALPDYTNLATTSDNCGVQSVTQSPAIGTTVSGAGDMIVTLTVTDINGLTNTCTFTVTKVDNTAPSITCPATQILVLGENCNAALPDYTNLATTGDNCGVQSVTQSPAIGTTVSGAGDMTVTLTVTDINGLTNTCTFTVTKVDNTAPSITCPTRQILVLGENCSAALPDYTNLATTDDNCGVQSVTQSPAIGTTVSGAGDMTVTLTVTDINGLTNTCTFTVTKVDNTAPSITCPTRQILVLGENCSAALPDYTNLATTGDNCGVQSVTQSPTAGTIVSGAGDMTVTLTVTDINGLTNTCTFTVTKVDNTPPSITCPTRQILVLGANCNAALPDYTSLATMGDNCGVQSVTQSPEAGTTVSGAGDMIVTLTVTDINGLTNTCTFTVTKVDNTPPSITCPATQILVLGENCSAALPDYTNLATTGDNCGVQSVAQSPAIGTTVSGAGDMIVILTVTDINGLTNTCTFTVTKVDNMPPTVQCFNQTVNFNGEENLALDANDLAEASDNCGVQSISLSPNTISATQVGQTVPATVTVTDINGNTATCTSNITVAGFPVGWSQQPGGAGCAGNSNTYNPGTGVWTATSTNCFYGPPYTSDATSFAQRTLCGNGSITAQVTSINGNGWAGVVMRESNAPSAKKAQLMTNLGTQSRREFRTATNGAASQQQFPSQNRYWLRIVRTGNQFAFYTSPNGTTWHLIGAQTIVMSNCIQMGLIATNYTANSTVTATFSGVSFTGNNGTLMAPLTPIPSLLAPYTFEVYPNPTGGELNVNLTQYLGKSVRMELYSIEGKLLQFSEIDEVQNGIKNLNLSEYSNGMYLVNVKSTGLPDATKRVVLQRE